MKNNKNKINQIVSAVLVIGFVICSYFFSSLAMKLGQTSESSAAWSYVIFAAIFFVFGLLLFYATRVGEGKAVKRFSLAVLLLIDIPSLYIILASNVMGLPLYQQLSSVPFVSFIAAVALGYGIPYTFFSGFELAQETDEEEAEASEEEAVEEEEPILKGGLAEELLETEKEQEAETEETSEEKEETEEAEEESTVEATEEEVAVEADEKDSKDDEKESEE
ncbi:MAG: hypothetical protein IJJ15_09365 [Ruminococcus sp.]|nr:hypothetical protein [Ruminococcus sp.]